MTDYHPQVFGLGQCSLDYLGTIKSFPQVDTKCEFENLTIQGGGPVATALVALSRWGISTAFAGVIGSDSFGSMIRESLKDEGVDTGGLVTRQGCASQFAFIVAEPGLARRTIFWRRPTGPPMKPDEVDYALLRRAGVLHTDGFFADASLAACKAARKAGVTVVVDAGSLRSGMLDLARESDYFIASEVFAKALVGDDNPLHACEIIAALGPMTAGVTLGAKGCVALDRGSIIQRAPLR